MIAESARATGLAGLLMLAACGTPQLASNPPSPVSMPTDDITPVNEETAAQHSLSSVLDANLLLGNTPTAMQTDGMATNGNTVAQAGSASAQAPLSRAQSAAYRTIEIRGVPMLVLVVGDSDNVCAQLTAANLSPDSTMLLFMLARRAGKSAVTASPGSYELDPSTGDADVAAIGTGSLVAADGSCDLTMTATNGGTVTLSTYTPDSGSAATGTFSALIAGKTVAGVFSAAACPSMALPIVPKTCQ